MGPRAKLRWIKAIKSRNYYGIPSPACHHEKSFRTKVTSFLNWNIKIPSKVNWWEGWGGGGAPALTDPPEAAGRQAVTQMIYEILDGGWGCRAEKTKPQSVAVPGQPGGYAELSSLVWPRGPQERRDWGRVGLSPWPPQGQNWERQKKVTANYTLETCKNVAYLLEEKCYYWFNSFDYRWD